MPRGVYKRKKLEQCPKCTQTFNKMGIATHMKHCKGVVNQIAKVKAIDAITGWVPTAINYEEEHRKLQSAYKQSTQENEMLRRIISSYKESSNSLCRAMIELNEVEGRWRA